MNLSSIVLSITAVALSGVASAQGGSGAFFVDVGSLGYGAGVPSNTYAAAAPTGGTWNALDTDLAVGSTTYTTPTLLDATGAPSGVTVEWNSLNGFNLLDFEFDEINTTGDDQALLDDLGYNSGPHEFRFHGLASGDYAVYTYAMAPDDPTFETLVSVIGSPDPQQTVVGDFAAGFALGTTHALHSVTVTAGTPLVIEVDLGVTADSINGIQVIPTSGLGLGMNYCDPAVPNSSGAPAVIGATGSAAVAANNVTLTCSSMPSFAFGFFIISQTQGFVANPAGSQGNLCLGGAIGRYVGPGQIQNSGQMGTIVLPIDLMMVPQPNGFVAVQPGETWNAQTWFRDSVGGMATSNFSDGLQIDFV